MKITKPRQSTTKSVKLSVRAHSVRLTWQSIVWLASSWPSSRYRSRWWVTRAPSRRWGRSTTFSKRLVTPTSWGSTSHLTLNRTLSTSWRSVAEVISSPMSGEEESSRRTLPSFSLDRSFKACSMSTLKGSCTETLSLIIFCWPRRVMSKFVILEFPSWSRIKIRHRLSNVELRLTLHPRFSEGRATKGSSLIFGVREWSYTRCSMEPCHSKPPTW